MPQALKLPGAWRPTGRPAGRSTGGRQRPHGHDWPGCSIGYEPSMGRRQYAVIGPSVFSGRGFLEELCHVETMDGGCRAGHDADGGYGYGVRAGAASGGCRRGWCNPGEGCRAAGHDDCAEAARDGPAYHVRSGRREGQGHAGQLQGQIPAAGSWVFVLSGHLSDHAVRVRRGDEGAEKSRCHRAGVRDDRSGERRRQASEQLCPLLRRADRGAGGQRAEHPRPGRPAGCYLWLPARWQEAREAREGRAVFGLPQCTDLPDLAGPPAGGRVRLPAWAGGIDAGAGRGAGRAGEGRG